MSGAGKIAAAAVVSALLAVVVRKQAPELALVLGLLAGTGVVLSCTGALREVLQFLEELTSAAGIQEELLQPLVKTCGIGILTRLASDFCKDAQSNMLASAVELAGTVLALAAALPLLTAVLDLLKTLL